MKKEGKSAMKKNRRNNAKKERTIMIASSVFVLAALTMTGIYMKSNQNQEEGDGYTIDFTKLEDNVEDKYEEIAKNDPVEESVSTPDIADSSKEIAGMDDDLDYLPMEAGSGLVQIPGLTDGASQEAPEDVPSQDTIAQEPEVVKEKPKDKDKTEDKNKTDAGATATPDVPVEDAGSAPDAGSTQNPDSAENTDSPAAEDTEGSAVAVEPLHFAQSEGLLRPVSGEVLIPFSMDGGVYFTTLDHFKYNPALMIAANQGEAVTACADGTVTAIFENEEIGHALTMDLGDGYQITYGQLDEIRVMEGSRVEPGQVIGFIAAPTKYFTLEGSNLYLKLTMNGTPMDPEALLQY